DQDVHQRPVVRGHRRPEGGTQGDHRVSDSLRRADGGALQGAEARTGEMTAFNGDPVMREKAIVLWSGGKDCALALWEARHQFDIVALLTTVTEAYDRISMHGVRTRLLDEQARAVGYPLEKVVIPPVC